MQLKKKKSGKLLGNPQRKAICTKLTVKAPTKPNSANRKIARVLLWSSKNKLIAKIPGESHNLQQHSTVLVIGSMFKDLIGINYALVRSKYDLAPVLGKKKSRSLFGVKKS